MLLFDAHSHLPAQALSHPLHHRVVCGTREADWEAVLAHGASQHQVVPMLGLHPWHVAGATPDWSLRLEALLGTHGAGIGECGLDFSRKETDRAAQERAFRTQLRLARALRRPVAMHVVGAWGALLQILSEEGVPPCGAMVHAYSGSPEAARALQAMGLLLSFSSAILEPTRDKARAALRAVAPRHLLLETDGSGDLEAILQAAAALRGTSVADLAVLTWENGRRCFKELLS
jgi:TatD DNase family protein